jgi:hypothetical protein
MLFLVQNRTEQNAPSLPWPDLGAAAAHGPAGASLARKTTGKRRSVALPSPRKTTRECRLPRMALTHAGGRTAPYSPRQHAPWPRPVRPARRRRLVLHAGKLHQTIQGALGCKGSTIRLYVAPVSLHPGFKGTLCKSLGPRLSLIGPNFALCFFIY